MVQADTQAKLRRLQRRIASFLHLESVLERSPSPTSSYGEQIPASLSTARPALHPHFSEHPPLVSFRGVCLECASF